MDSIILIHNYMRYAVLAIVAISIINALVKDFSKKPYSKTDGIINRIAVSSLHVQLLIGLVLYVNFIKAAVQVEHFMKDARLRYYSVEHITIMLAAVVIATIGSAKAKRAAEGKQHKTIWVFELVAVILIAVGLLTMPA